MCKTTFRALTGAVVFVALFGAGSASADYGTVTSWEQKYEPLSKPTDLGVGVNTAGVGWDVDLPADFTFRYFGENLTYIRPHGYGVIGFNKNEFISSSNPALPNSGTPNGSLIPFWEYWNRYSQDPYEGGVSYKIEGTGNKQVLKVQWQNMPYYYCYPYGTSADCANMKHFSWQVWIYESDGVEDSIIQFHYAPIYVPEGCSGNCLNFYENYYGWNYAPYDDITGTVGLVNRTRTRGIYGLACRNDCRQKDWPGDKVVMFGQPSGPELIPSMSVKSLVSTEVETTLTATVGLRNVGAGDATGVTYTYYLSKDTKLDVGTDLVFASRDPVFDVLSGEVLSFDDSLSQPKPDPGWYHICLFADSEEVAEEAFESNNQLCTAGRYIVGVDFTGAMIVPSVAGPGDEMNVDLTVTNVGFEPGELFYRILLSEDDKVSDDDILLFANDEAVLLQGQESFAENRPLLIPSDALGTHENEVPRYVLLQFDPDDTVLEADEKNNLLVSTPVTLIKADLRVDTATLEMPDGCFFGRPVTLTMDLSNNGAARARAFDNALVVSDNGVITAYDQAVRLSPAFCAQDVDCIGTLGDGSFCNVDSNTCSKFCFADTDCVNSVGDGEGLSCLIRSGETEGTCQNTIPGYDVAQVRFSGDLPVTDPNGAPLLDGTWFFGAVTDFYDAVNEGNEGNNARPTGASVECFAPAPDFLATSIKLPASGAGGEQLSIRRSILNRGNLDGSVTWRYYLSSNPVVSSKDIVLPFASGVGATTPGEASIAAGKTDEGTDVVVLPSALTAGVYYLGIVIDPDDAVHELSNDNNLLVAPGTVDVKAAALRIATSSLPPATIQVTYLRQLVATGGAGAYSWSATNPPLPPGMRLQTDGVLTGKPVEEGAYVFGVRVQSGGSFAEGLLYLPVLPATGPLTVSTDLLPSAYVDVPYRVELAAVGGSPPYTWSIIGRLPQGLSLKNNTITGSAEIADGTSDPRTFRVQVRDARGTTSERELALPVLRSADLSIQTTRIQDGLVGQPYQQIIRAAGGEPPYEFEITGLEETGLTTNNNSDTTALVSGIPEASGYFEMVVRVKDQSEQTATQTFKFAVIGQAIQIQTDRALPVAKAGELYPETQLIAGTPEVSWQLFSGEMPPGIELSTSGVLSGTVDKAASPRTYTFLARAFDTKGGEGFGSFSITIEGQKLEARYTTEKKGCGGNASGGSASGMLLPLLGAALLLLRRRR